MKSDSTIHAARIQPRGPRPVYLLLRKIGDNHFVWFEEEGGKEQETAIAGTTIPEALAQARLFWKGAAFRTVNCGFRFTLPERDEHGENALFCQMTSSYSSMNGIYFDEELGHTCIVKEASQEALNLWKRLKEA